MSTLALEGTMLYCPKCKTKYKDGSQRFCNNDGGRLLPAPSAGGGQSRDNKVFTSLLGRSSARNEKDETLARNPRFVKVERETPKFEPPAKSKIFKPETDGKHTAPKNTTPRPVAKRAESPGSAAKPLAKLIQSNEVAESRANLGNRKTNPTGRHAVTWQDPRALIGQTIKGRYKVVDKLDQDQTSIAYLAEDQLIKNKKVAVRVLMNDLSKDPFQKKIFADERISLSHVNHPNVVRAIDSGELPEGKPFIVTDLFEGESVNEVLNRSGQFNPMRVARIIRQASFALSEAHQSGVLHRNLKPEHLLLLVSDAGTEQVKVTNFSTSDGKPRTDNLAYKSPEQLGGQLPTFASDSYSLAAISFQMLTGQIPFTETTERTLLKAQKAGLKANASDLGANVPEVVDHIFAKALSFNPADRYPKARDFGDALFNALMTEFPAAQAPESEESESIRINAADPSAASADLAENETLQAGSAGAVSDFHIPSTDDANLSTETETETIDLKPQTEQSDALWKNRSPEALKERGWLFTLLSVLGVLLLVGAAIWLFVYFYNRGDQTVDVEQPTETETVAAKKPTIQSAKEAPGQKGDIDFPPPAREISQPPNTLFFENTKQNLSPNLVKHFRGFSLFYPKTWEKNNSESTFLDISKKAKNDLPKEQMLITHYDSKGTYSEDKESFDVLVESSNKVLENLLPEYSVVSQGKISINNGWQAYEVKFKAKGETASGKEFEVWGRRIWMPAARPGVKDGFVITMLATSLSERVESLDDVGVKGDLGDILETFEPSREYN
ncbi:MAG: serine/threonine-protein kinase [Pyrinomonadaceae bacterium]